MVSRASLIVCSLLIVHVCAQYSDGQIKRRYGNTNPSNGVKKLCVDRKSKDSRNKFDTPFVPKRGCGWRNSNDTTNSETKPGEFPWMVAVRFIEYTRWKTVYRYSFGGSLIVPNVVLVAAHSLKKHHHPKNLVVRGGEWDLQQTSKTLIDVQKSVKEIILHENFDKITYANDVALLILKEPLVLQENIRPICLIDNATNIDYSRCYATGWRKDKPGTEVKNGNILQKNDLHIVPIEFCQKYLDDDFDASFLCARESNKDTCTGEDSSSLVCPIPGVEDRYYQAGIVSRNTGCDEENVPGVYSNIPYLRSWISEKLAERDIEFDSFTP